MCVNLIQIELEATYEKGKDELELQEDFRNWSEARLTARRYVRLNFGLSSVEDMKDRCAVPVLLAGAHTTVFCRYQGYLCCVLIVLFEPTCILQFGTKRLVSYNNDLTNTSS